MKHRTMPLVAVAIILSACNNAKWITASPQPPAFAQDALPAYVHSTAGETTAVASYEVMPDTGRKPAKERQSTKEITPSPAREEKAHPVNKELSMREITLKATPPEQQEKASERKPGSEKIIGADGRLIHPWYTAKEVPAAEFEGELPNWFNESLKFKIGWSFITAGEANLITNKMVDADGQNAFAVEAYAQSYSVIDKMFKVRDMNVSWIAGDLKKSLGYWQSVREGRYKRDEWLKFNYKDNNYTVYKQNNKGQFSEETSNFTGAHVWDILTALYYVRMQELPLNGEIYFDIVNVKKQYPLKVIVHGKETVTVKAGKFNCVLVEPVISGEGIFVSKGKSLKVWLTDDEYKMPVKMSVEVFIGSVKAELTSYNRAKK
jgi:hypothetical protein